MFSIRDPVHNWIKFSATEKDLINSPLVQRLKWVMQLSGVFHVFNGGTHTRFEHSLGAMHISGMYMEHLLRDDPTWLPKPPAHYITVARVAGLLHDIGHGPFSHVFDKVVYAQIYETEHGHDAARFDLIRHKLLRPLIEKCGVTVEEISWVWNSKLCGIQEVPAIYKIIGAVVQGPLGADRIDFTLRDSYHTGTTHLGTIAYERIISNASIRQTHAQPTLCYNFKCIRDIISALDGRLYLYHDVYLHKTSMAASLLMEEMLADAIDTLDLVECCRDPQKFRFLNDNTILGKLTTEHPQTVSEKMCAMILERRLPRLLQEKIVHADDIYDPEVYIQKWVGDELAENQRLARSRIISGISTKKFEKYNIKFYDKSNESIFSCADALDKIKYHSPQPPYYLVRLFQIEN